MKSVGRSETGSPNHKSRLSERGERRERGASFCRRRSSATATAAAALDCMDRQVSVEREENGFRGKMILIR